ncbi:MAG: pyridoxamine 5'-phosphate oxidase family protein [Clostridiales bacterium]|nr:pyridoxamine 5'-phosphate oxidase family protein [Clostridiales bacterium]
MTDNSRIEKFIRKQKVAFICSVDEAGFPNVKAMLKPRRMVGLQLFYFSTNTSSMRVKQYRDNPNACVYFYHKGLIKYIGWRLSELRYNIIMTGMEPTDQFHNNIACE